MATVRSTLVDRTNTTPSAAISNAPEKPTSVRHPDQQAPRRNPPRAACNPRLATSAIKAIAADADEDDYEEEEDDEDEDDHDLDDDDDDDEPPTKSARKRGGGCTGGARSSAARSSVASSCSPPPLSATTRKFRSADERQAYEDRRRKNNAAARLSRARRTDREREHGDRIRTLESEVEHWRQQCQRLTTPANFNILVNQCNHVGVSAAASASYANASLAVASPYSSNGAQFLPKLE